MQYPANNKMENFQKSQKQSGSPRFFTATVLHLVANLNPSNESKELIETAIKLSRQGWRQLIASSGGPLIVDAERSAIRHFKIPLGGRNPLAKVLAKSFLDSLLKREKPDIIHVHDFEMLYYVARIISSKRIPLLVDLVEPKVPSKNTNKILSFLSQKRAWFRVPSVFMYNFLRNECELQSKFIYRVLPGVDLRWFDFPCVSPGRLQKLSELWRFSEQAILIIYPAPLAQGYGHEQLLEALSRINRRDIFTVIVGNGTEASGFRKKLEKIIVNKGLAGQIVMSDFCPDWPAACWLSSFMVAANNKPRGQALELLYAQAMGRPVIVTDCGANAEMVKRGETAWIINPNDIDALVEAIKEATNLNQQQRTNLALTTRSFIAETFPQENYISSLTGIYNEMLNSKI